jgi:methionine-rich copper-binding protein CopC
MRTLHPLLVGSILAVAITLTGATAASAHDDLISSTPTPGEQLAAPPTEVTLEFVSDVMSIGANLMVIDAAGTDWATGEPVLAGTRATIAVSPDMPVAGYQVRWQVVGSDGHPISGFIPFTIGDAKPMGMAATDDTADAPAAVTTQVQATTESNPVLRIVLLGAAGAVAALGVLLLINFLRRRATSGRTDSDAASAPVERT